MKTNHYSEGPESLFSEDGTYYELDVLFSLVMFRHPVKFKVDDLKWVLEYATPDEVRVETADLSAPILVHTYKDGRLSVVDGLHRLAKAVRNNVHTLEGYMLSNADMRLAKVDPSKLKKP